MAWYDPGGPTKVLAELWADWLYRQPMASDGDVVYLPGQTGCRQVRSWRLRVAGGCDRLVTIGTLPGGRWWVSVSWELHGAYGHMCDGEPAAEARALRLREQWPVNPGEWVETSLAAATVRA